MKIGNLPERGTLFKLNKWYFAVHIMSRPSYKIGIFQPCVLLCLTRVYQYGEPYKINGKPEKKFGGFRFYTFPYGISITITK